MKANELRIGNLILSAFKNIETVRMILGHEGYKDRSDVHEIYKHLIGVEENRNQYNLAEIKPIPLTEDWLIKFGFEKVNASGLKYYNNGKLNIALDFSINYDSGQRVYLKYVHELQNIYFALTGEELK